MNIIKIIGYFIISIFNFIMLMLSYNKLTKSRFKYNFKNIIVILVGSLIFTLNFYYSPPTFKILINFLVVYISTTITGNENYSISLINVIIVYLISFVVEIIASSIVMLINVVDMNAFNSNILLKAIITFIDLMSIYLICSIKYVINISNKLSSKMNNNILLLLVVFFSVIILVISDIRFFVTFSNKIYFSNFIILVCLIIIIVCAVKSYLDTEKEKHKTEAILNFMKKYEKIIDEDRAKKHEILNELLLLKSINNKESKEYNNILDELIDKYTNKDIKIKNIYNLPSGLKGIFYYKLNGLHEKGYDININVNKKASNSLKRIKHEDFVSLYRILGIVLDNTVEAACDSLKKYILIDIYENKNIIIEISNSFKGKIDINKLDDKYYSTKGNNRGLGLYLIKNILNKSKNISVNRKIENNIFTTEIIVNKK